MTSLKQILTLITALMTTLLIACGGGNTTQSGESDKEAMAEDKGSMEAEEASRGMEEKLTIAGITAETDNFSTLAAAVKAADLIAVLESEGPFTVFAPTNEAFAKIPAKTLDNLLLPESQEPLAQILKYHVISGKYTAADVVAAINSHDGEFVLTTVQGNELTASLDGDKVKLTDATGGTATVIMTDVQASNGIVHAIDQVVMPK